LDTALLLLRSVVGLYVAAHGARFLFGWFGGLGLSGTQAFMGSRLGFRPAWLWAFGLGLAEFGGGVLTALGLLGPIGPIGIAVPLSVSETIGVITLLAVIVALVTRQAPAAQPQPQAA